MPRSSATAAAGRRSRRSSCCILVATTRPAVPREAAATSARPAILPMRAGGPDRRLGGVNTDSHRRYLPIADRGVVGDLRSVALVGTDGTIDWFCCPRFDAPSVFGALLDADVGGHFRIT